MGDSRVKSFWSSRLWFTRSKAFLKSTKTALAAPPRSNVDCQAWSTAVSAWVVDLFRLHLDWCGSNCGSNVVRIHWPTIDSSTFARHGSNEIGRMSVCMEVRFLYRYISATVTRSVSDFARWYIQVPAFASPLWWLHPQGIAKIPNFGRKLWIFNREHFENGKSQRCMSTSA